MIVLVEDMMFLSQVYISPSTTEGKNKDGGKVLGKMLVNRI